ERPNRPRVERKGAGEPVLYPGQARNPWRQTRLVDADDVGPHLLQRPAPAAGAAAEIEALLARLRATTDQGQCLPQLQIGAARRLAAVRDKMTLAIGKRTDAARRRKQCPGIEQGP